MFKIDPQVPVKIVCDEIDECKIKEADMGVLSHPAAVASVRVIHNGGWEMICESRWLAIHSNYFRRLLSRFPSPSVVTIPDCVPVEGLAGAMQFINNGEIDVIPSKVAPLLSAAFQLEIPQLQRRLEHYLRVLSNINESHFLLCWNICYIAPASVQLRDEMLRRASEMFDTLYGNPEWPRVSEHLIRQLFVRQDLKVKTATSIFEAALTWIIGNPSIEPAAADRIMSVVPFYRMSAIDRMQCLEKAKRMQLTSLVRPRVMLADWHVSCHDAGQDNASDMRPIKPDEVHGEKRLRQRYQDWNKDKPSKASSTDQTRPSSATTPETPSTSNLVSFSRDKQKQMPPETQTSETSPSKPVLQKQTSESTPGLGKPLRFSSETRIVHDESPVSLRGPFLNIGKPIRFSATTSIKNARVTYKTPVALDGPFLDLGKPIRFSAQTAIKQLREDTGPEKDSMVRSAPTGQSADGSGWTQPKSMLDRSEPTCYSSPLVKKDRIAIAQSPAAVEGPFVNLGTPIRFSSETLIKKLHGDHDTVLSSLVGLVRDSALSASESGMESTGQRSTATVSGTESSKLLDYGFNKPLRFNPAKWMESQKETEEASLPTTPSSENVLISSTVSAGSKKSSEDMEESEPEKSFELGKPIRFAARAMIKQMLEKKGSGSSDLDDEKSDPSSTSSVSLAL